MVLYDSAFRFFWWAESKQITGLFHRFIFLILRQVMMVHQPQRKDAAFSPHKLHLSLTLLNFFCWHETESGVACQTQNTCWFVLGAGECVLLCLWYILPCTNQVWHSCGTDVALWLIIFSNIMKLHFWTFIVVRDGSTYTRACYSYWYRMYDFVQHKNWN